jgi:hypothetical protein
VFEWLGVLDFFNNREKAILLWTVGFGVFAAIKSDGLGGSFLSVLGALASPKLVLLVGSAALYCATLLFLASAAELWHNTALKATVPDGFLTRENAEGFLVAQALTLAFVPFLYGVAWVSRREQANLRRRFRPISDSPA